ncbi:Cell cycle serine/threonine-protein kinase hsk1, partial [Grifola frondosa]
MATTALLSQHSSNPLEVPSSDARNKAYRRRMMRARQINRANADEPSSDDPLNDYTIPELDQYHAHLAELYPNSSTLAAQLEAMERRDLEDVDDDDMNSDHSQSESGSGDEHGEDDAEDSHLQDDTDDEMSLYLKPREEQEEITEEIADLEEAVPQLQRDYKLVDRLGTGTFSSVYKAIDLGYHNKWDNSPWQGHHPPSSSAHYQSVPHPPVSKVFVAVKRIHVTSGPQRIKNEIAIMELCRGCRHVSQLITAFRERDQVVAIMPYHRNVDFREYYKALPMEGIKAYFRCMFRALRDIHTRFIIHRDVKPANFLFDPRTGVGTLCDFGLACHIEEGPSSGLCLHTMPTRTHPHGQVRPRHEYDVELVRQSQRDSRMKSSWPSEKVGYPLKDTRPHSKANRAGTRGFRAPEVLLKCGEQSGAIDVWSAGTILLFFLTGKFPLFNSSDDVEALMEIATVIGKKRMDKTALLHSRVFQTNVPSITSDGISWHEFVERQNPDLFVPRKPDPRYYPYATSHPPPSSSSPGSGLRFSPGLSSPTHPESEPVEVAAHQTDVAHALDLAEKLLHPEATQRMTPRRALAHAFLRERDAPEDDEFVPHLWGGGVCGSLHFLDEETDEYCVQVRVAGQAEMEVRRVMAGEGIAIGSEPCEFHRGDGSMYLKNDHRRTRTCNLLVPSAIEAKRATIAPAGSSTSGGSGGTKKLKEMGRLWLTDERLIFVSDAPSGAKPPAFESLSIPLTSLVSTKFEQPRFGANYLVVDVRPAPDGGLTEGTRAEIRMRDKGIFEFVSSLEKTRERAVYMKRQSADEEEGLPSYMSPADAPSSSSSFVARVPEDNPPGYEA